MKVKFNWGGRKGALHAFQLFPGPKCLQALSVFFSWSQATRAKAFAILCNGLIIYMFALLPSLLCSQNQSSTEVWTAQQSSKRNTWLVAVGHSLGSPGRHLASTRGWTGMLRPTLCWGSRTALVGAYVGMSEPWWVAGKLVSAGVASLWCQFQTPWGWAEGMRRQSQPSEVLEKNLCAGRGNLGSWCA